LKAWGERQWVAVTIQDVRAGELERFASYSLKDGLKRLVLFVRTCRTERGEAVADQVADLLCELRHENRVLVGNLAKKEDPLMDEVQGRLTMADWGRYYDTQIDAFVDDEGIARWNACKAIVGL